MKATEGTVSTDSAFEANWAEADAAAWCAAPIMLCATDRRQRQIRQYQSVLEQGQREVRFRRRA